MIADALPCLCMIIMISIHSGVAYTLVCMHYALSLTLILSIVFVSIVTLYQFMVLFCLLGMMRKKGLMIENCYNAAVP